MESPEKKSEAKKIHDEKVEKMVKLDHEYQKKWC